MSVNLTDTRRELIIEKLAIAIVVVWLAACYCGHFLDVRLMIMAAALGMAVVSVALLRRWFAVLFTPSTTRIAIGLAAAGVMVAATYLLFPIVTDVIPDVGASTRSLYGLMRVPHATVPILIAVI